MNGKRIAVFGLQTTGKTTYVKNVFCKGRYIVFDSADEYKGFNRYVFTRKTRESLIDGMSGLEEFNLAMNKLVNENYSKIDTVILDEANRWLPNKQTMPESFLHLNDWCGVNHWNVNIVTLCRRPSQIHTDIMNLAHEFVIFRLRGKNDIQRLNEECEGLGDAVKVLKQFEYITMNSLGEFEKHAPVRLERKNSKSKA